MNFLRRAFCSVPPLPRTDLSTGEEVFYHGTTRIIKGDFRLLSHFGTAAAANKIIDAHISSFLEDISDSHSYLLGLLSDHFCPSIHAVRLSIHAPLLIEDLGKHTMDNYKKTLRQSGVFSGSEIREIFQSKENWKRALSDALIKKGYDGMVYVNCVEDEDSRSYIILNPDQVKPAYCRT